MAPEALEPTEPVEATPSEEEREGKRGHDDGGNVRPADGRWNLHEPEEESDVCGPANAVSTDDVVAPARRARKAGR